MLALTRKKGESIIVSDDIEIVILGVQNDQVKLGISAPKNIPVHRKEIYLQIQDENRLAATKVSETKITDFKGIGDKLSLGKAITIKKNEKHS